MLINLKTAHKPESLREAAELLKRPGNYPVYGGGAALIRQNSRDIEEVVDLSPLLSSACEVKDDDCYLGPCATLETIAEAQPELAAVIKADAPLTLRNTLTLGDVLLEARPDSLFLTLLYGLAARIDTPEGADNNLIEIDRWFDMAADERRQHLLLGIVIPHFPDTPWRFAFEKVSRTPADAPIVGVIGFAYAEEPDPGAYAVVCGLDHRPQRYSEGMQSTIGDYKGSVEYRTEMAKVLYKRAIAKAIELRATE